MQIPTNGLTQKDILNLLKDKYFKEDLEYSSGKIIGSMCGEIQIFAERVYSMSLEKDIGLPDVFQGSIELEKEVIQMIGGLFSNRNAAGHIVSGGSEANLTAIWSARNAKKVDKPEIIVPASHHFSFDKIANLLAVKLRIAQTKNFRVDPGDVEELITDDTVAIVGTAGTTELGVTDPIPELSKIAYDNNIHLHVDAAFGGFIIPFLKKLGYKTTEFDFQLPGVCSITSDPHKWLRVPAPSGGILFRDESFFDSIQINADYLHKIGTPHKTLMGTRPAAPIVATWAILNALGEEGLKNEVAYSMELTDMLYQRTKELKNIQPVIKPELNIVSLKSEKINPRDMTKELRKSGFVLFPFQNSVRAVLLPYLRRVHIEELILALERLDKKL